MLYVSTKNKTDSYTAHRALCEQSAPDGGSFVPFLLPEYDEEQLEAIYSRGFNENVANTLNLFFSTGLNGWDVDFCIGRYCSKLITLNNRIFIGELWHNLDTSFEYACLNLYNKLCSTQGKTPTPWAKIAIRIAFLTGLIGLLHKKTAAMMDVALPSGDFSWPMAAWYCRKMGLPIGMIICSCNDNNGPWDLIHRGEFNTGNTKIITQLPELDVPNPAGLEQLIYGVFGMEETKRYLDICEERGLYTLDEEQLAKLANGLYVGVVGKRRVDSIIGNFFRTNGYVIDGYTALSYGALQDYRSRTGENRNTLLLAERSPVLSAERVTNAIGVDEKKLNELVHSIKE